MSLIEGIGDEVAVFGVILLTLILAATFTFILNSSPVSERLFTQTTNIPSSQQNLGSHQQEEQSDRNGNIETIDSIPNPNSSVNHEERDVFEPTNENVLDDNCPDETILSNTTNSRVYPNVPEETISGNINEEREVENENSSSNPGLSHIRLKYLNDTERSVTSCLTTTIGEFKRTHFAEELADNKVVRLIYAGQCLRDHATLQSYGIADNCVIHVQVVEAQVPNPSSSSQNVDLDLSHLLWPLLSVILGICWILYFKYPEFFNFMSLGILFLFTGSFIYFYSQVQMH